MTFCGRCDNKKKTNSILWWDFPFGFENKIIAKHMVQFKHRVRILCNVHSPSRVPASVDAKSVHAVFAALLNTLIWRFFPRVFGFASQSAFRGVLFDGPAI